MYKNLRLILFGLFALLCNSAFADEIVIPNFGFEDCTPATNEVLTSGSAQGTDYSENGWTLVHSAGWSNSAVIAYGGSVNFNGVVAPATAPDGDANNKNALGVTVGWGVNQQEYKSASAITLPAGTYYLKAYAYNGNTSATQATSLLGVEVDGGTGVTYSTRASYPSSQWVVDYVKFTLEEEASVYVHIGLQSFSGTGSGGHAKVFFDNVTITNENDMPFKDGDRFYLKNKATGKYLGRGLAWNTHAAVGYYGIGVEMELAEATMTGGKYYLKGLDNNDYFGHDGDVYSDAGTGLRRAYEFSEPDADGYFTITNTINSKLFFADVQGQDIDPIGGDGEIGSNCTEDEASWKVLSKDDYEQEIADAYNAQRLNAINDANLNDAEEAGTLWTMQAPVATVVSTDWTMTEQNNNGGESWAHDANQNHDGNNVAQMWNTTGYFSKTLTDLPEGLYKITMKALYRSGSPAEDLPKYNTGFNTVLAYLKANGNTVQVKPWAEDRVDDGNPNTTAQAKALFDEDKYTAEVYAYVGTDGKLDLMVNEPSRVGNTWFVLGDVIVQSVIEAVPHEIYIYSNEGDLNCSIVADKEMAAIGETVTVTVTSHKLAKPDQFGIYLYDDNWYYLTTAASNFGEGDAWDTYVTELGTPLTDLDYGEEYQFSFVMPNNNVYLWGSEFLWLPHMKLDVAKEWTTYINPDVPVLAGETYTFDYGTLQGWTTIDADGDGNNWYVYTNSDTDETYATSASYDDYYGALTPDNYLVSPKLKLGGTMNFAACAQDASYPSEVFGVAVSTTGNTDAADFTMISGAQWTMTAAPAHAPKRVLGSWYEFTVDLSAYDGQEGYVAIRHFDCTDQFRLNIDNINFSEAEPVEIEQKAYYTPDGLTAYLVTEVDDEAGTVSIEEQEYVMPGMPYVFEKTGDETIFYLEEKTLADVPLIAMDERFIGVTDKEGLEVAYDEKKYALTEGEFRLFNGIIPMGKCFLDMDKGPSKAKPFYTLVKNGEVTGITLGELSNSADGKIYNLQGQRVSKVTGKGLYIVNGKKQVIK